jgi:hypothetical protein
MKTREEIWNMFAAEIKPLNSTARKMFEPAVQDAWFGIVYSAYLLGVREERDLVIALHAEISGLKLALAATRSVHVELPHHGLRTWIKSVLS